MPSQYGSRASRATTKPTPSYRRSRNEFKAWLIYELQRRGAELPPDPTYLQLQDATRAVLAAADAHHRI